MAFGRKKRIDEIPDPIASIFDLELAEGEPPSVIIESDNQVVSPDQASMELDTPNYADQPLNNESASTPEKSATSFALLTQVLNRIDFLNSQFESRLKYDESRELQVTKLYDELDAYRQNAQIEQMMTLARGIFDVLDKLEPESSFQMSLDHLREELIECLAVVGIERIQDSTEELGAQAQMVVGFLDDTSDVATRVRKQGYRLGESVVRKRQIEIKKA
jgi:molecular chaperone GrpE (heat shock protein)